MASQRASITKELLRESLESVLKPFKIHSLDDGKFSCVLLEFLMGRKVFVNRPTGSGTQLVVSNIRLFSSVHSPRARCEESVLSGYGTRYFANFTVHGKTEGIPFCPRFRMRTWGSPSELMR